MAACFEIKATDSGAFSFVLKAANGQVILSSQTYTTEAACRGGIASVQENGSKDERFELKDASDGRPFFNLKAGNGQVIGTSQMYADASGRAKGVESVKANAATTNIRMV